MISLETRSRNDIRGQGLSYSDQKIVGVTPPSQDASIHHI